jgi:hypothetical protein
MRVLVKDGVENELEGPVQPTTTTTPNPYEMKKYKKELS